MRTNARGVVRVRVSAGVRRRRKSFPFVFVFFAEFRVLTVELSRSRSGKWDGSDA